MKIKLLILVSFALESLLVASNRSEVFSQNNSKSENIMVKSECINTSYELSSRLLQIASRDYLLTLKNESTRMLKLEEYLIAKVFKNSERINAMIIPEVRSVFDSLVQVLKPRTEHYVKRQPNITVAGSWSCSLERVAYERPKVPVAVCPWRWLIIVRDDRFPFKRANAKCNCVNCQAKTIYDSDVQKLAGCKTENVLMPALFRETLVENLEKWKFVLEEVPVSCVCSIKLEPL